MDYRKEFNFNAIYLIPANLYGPGDNFDPELSHVIPSLIRRFDEAVKKKKEKVEVWGSGKASREFFHVRDAARAIVLALKKYNDSNPLNLGAGKDYMINDIVKMIAGNLKYSGEIHWDASKPEGQIRRCFDVSKAKKEIDFKAVISLEEGLKETIKWYKAQK